MAVHVVAAKSETVMPNFSVKLVDHTGASDTWKQGVRKQVQDIFDQLFAGSTGTVSVQWGAGQDADLIVVHYAKDVESSYLQQKMPGEPLKKHIGGHTRTPGGGVTGSEVYKFSGPVGQRSKSTLEGYAKLILHECMHNQFPHWTEADMHGPAGGGGLAASPPQLPPTQKNKDLMQVANTFKGKVKQLL